VNIRKILDISSTSESQKEAFVTFHHNLVEILWVLWALSQLVYILLLSISSTVDDRILCTQAFFLVTFWLWTNFRTKNVCLKRWWNWHLTSFSSLSIILQISLTFIILSTFPSPIFILLKCNVFSLITIDYALFLYYNMCSILYWRTGLDRKKRININI